MFSVADNTKRGCFIHLFIQFIYESDGVVITGSDFDAMNKNSGGCNGIYSADFGDSQTVKGGLCL